ncbi:hypothetical protein A6J50_06130 [Neisseria meningitidis]|nr:hypothetical protein A6J54_03555 [Neisseria meningitidis]ARC09980.1 hypothetical protein A6J50_06130 [Neisseria meningitidis]
MVSTKSLSPDRLFSVFSLFYSMSKYAVIPAQAGIQCVEFQLFRINFETLIPSFPRKWESSFLSFSHFR